MTQIIIRSLDQQWYALPQKKASLCSSQELRDTNDPGPLMKPHNTLQKGPHPVNSAQFEDATLSSLVEGGNAG